MSTNAPTVGPASNAESELELADRANPWKGLHFYTEQDKSLFFGRDREIDELLAAILRGTLSVLFARSGLGKTSLLRAGVVPRLQQQEFLPVILRLDYATPSPTPGRQVIETVLGAAAAARIDVEPANGYASADGTGEIEETLWEFFHRTRFSRLHNDPVRLVLIFDQFEEVFTLGRQSPYAEEFLAELADLVENRMPASVRRRLEASGQRSSFDSRSPGHKVVLALREDYVARLDSLQPVMPAVMLNRYALAPLDFENSVEVVLRAGHRWVSETVARQIVVAVAGQAVAQAGRGQTPLSVSEIEPAYLSVMCHGLFERMTSLDKETIDAELVTAEHGSILDGLYERSFSGLDPRTRLFVEDRLLTSSGFRKSEPLAEAEREGVPAADLDALVDRRLLRREERLGTTHVELSHDLLTAIAYKSRAGRQAEATRQAEARREAELIAQLRRSRRHTWAAATLSSLLLAMVIIGLYGWVIPYESYCRGFTKRWGTVHPVGALPVSAVAHRASTYKISWQGWFGKPLRMEVIGANGEPVAGSAISTYLDADKSNPSDREKPARFEFVYDRTGKVVYEVAFDRFGHMVWGLVYTPGTGEAIEASGFASLKQFLWGANGSRRLRASATFFGPDGHPQPQRSSLAEIVQISYDAEGFERERKYTDREGRPRTGPDQAFGVRMGYDADGREIRKVSLNDKGEPMIDEVGNAGMELRYDTDGNPVEARAFDVQGDPTLVKWGFYRITFKYDEWGRETERSYFGLGNERVAESEDWNAHRIRAEYDDNGNLKSIKLYGNDDQPALTTPEGFDFPLHEIRRRYDQKNRLELVTYFDQQGRALSSEDGIHGYRLEYDGQGFVSAYAFVDANDLPAQLRSSGAHRGERSNDEFGQAREERFFDAQRKPMITSDGGYHLRRNEYDKAGNLLMQSYFDASGQPVPDRLTGSHRIVRTFVRYRNLISEEFFDQSGHPIDNKQGFHRVRHRYNRLGLETESRWFSADNKPCNGPEGVHFVSKMWDELRGLLVHVAVYDTKEKPAIDKYGVHEAYYEYNDKRQRTKWQIFGLNRAEMEDRGGDHIVQHEYDAKGRETKLTQLGINGKPNFDPELGIATRKQVWDAQHRWIEQSFHDAADRLVIGPFGFARGKAIYHADGRFEFHHFGADDKLRFNPLVGYAVKKMDLRRRGDTVEAYFGSDQLPTQGPEGFAEAHRRWSDDGSLLSVAYFGPDGKPVFGPGGYHRMELSSNGSRTARYFDARNRELTAQDADAFVSVFYIKELPSIKQPAARAGLQVGDVLWRYGRWSFADAFDVEHARGGARDEILGRVWQGFLAERDRSFAGTVDVTVIRRGGAVMLKVPKAEGGVLGFEASNRTIPLDTFGRWRRGQG